MIKGQRTLKNPNILEIGKILIFFVIFSGFVFAQTQVFIAPTPKPKSKNAPKPKPAPESGNCDEESPLTLPTTAPAVISNRGRVAPITAPNPILDEEVGVRNSDDIPYEKSIEVEREVAITLCVSEGNVRINGWERNEVRAFVSGGSKLGFRVATPKKKNGKTSSITVLGYDPKEARAGNSRDCLYGNEIELDVPIGARISLKGIDTKIIVKSVAKVTIANNEGDISLSEIEEGIDAKTFEGDISVENSSGVIKLDSTNGNIFAYDTDPLEVGDALTAKSNSGSVVLQTVNHSVVEANSISGLIRFIGEIQADGQYRFENTSGQIILEIPEESSCLLEAIAAKNRFSATGFKFIRFDVSKIDSTLQQVKAQMGEGEATISLQSGSGKITLVKLKL